MTVLVVEDQPNLAEPLQDQLEAMGHSCLTACDIAEAEWMLESVDVDVLVLDLSFESPLGRTDGDVIVDGRRLGRFEGSNGRRQIRLHLPGPAPRGEIHLTLSVAHPFRPRRESSDSVDERELGVFVHQVRLLPG